jgi:hypothetical protein
MVFVATSRTFETTDCSILPFNPDSALSLLRFLPDCGLTEFLLPVAPRLVWVWGTAILVLFLPAYLSASGTIGFFVSCFGALLRAFTSLVVLSAALLSLGSGLAAAFDAGLPTALATRGLAGFLTDLDWVFDAGFSIGIFEELLDAFLGAALLDAADAFFAVAVNAGFFAAALFLAEVTTVFITSLPDLPNALFKRALRWLFFIASRPPFLD